jgi:hypothetical protein
MLCRGFSSPTISFYIETDMPTMNLSGSQATGAEVWQLVVLYCVIAVLLNGVLALSRVLWREVAYNHGLLSK